ncbi:hypothetical protein HDU77_010119 [Chytriomyces hyalinus]|nr:hypothetical protein HDU77_010119 [Chytriomyces hyalinus]
MRDYIIETFYGHVKTVRDAEICLEACIQRRLPLITQMPLVLSGLCIRSGTIIVFPENASNFQLNRSASRICGNFLLYREIEKPAKNGQGQGTLLPKTPYSRPGTSEKSGLFSTLSLRKNTTLVPNGLAKRTITLTGSDGLKYRVINYFYPQDVEHLYEPNLMGSMRTPSDYPDLVACHNPKIASQGSIQSIISPAPSPLPSPALPPSSSSSSASSSSPSLPSNMSIQHLVVPNFVVPSSIPSSSSSSSSSSRTVKPDVEMLVSCGCGGCFNLSQHLQHLRSHPPAWTEEFIRLPPLRNSC